MKSGIHNPFVKKEDKEAKLSKFEIGEIDTDVPQPIPPVVHLDGGRYVIHIKDAENVSAAVERLLTLTYAVAKTHERELNLNGLYVGPRFVKDTERALTRNGRQLTVYSPEDCAGEEAIYRRIAYTLMGLPLKQTYAKLGVEIMERNS
jgi:hypothetical protein